MNRNEPGFILVTVLAIVSIIVLICTRLSDQAVAYVSYARYQIDAIKAEQLARSGIDVIISQLSDVKTVQKEENEQKQKFDQRKFAAALLQHLNFWQQILFKYETDGTDAVLRVYATSEDGKLSVPAFIQKADQKEKNSLYKFINSLNKPASSQEQLAEAIAKIAKKRNYPFNELQELYAVPEINQVTQGKLLPHFAQAIKETKDATEKSMIDISLSDLFSLYNTSEKISIWTVTAPLLKLFGLADKRSDEPVQRKNNIQELIQKIKSPNESLESLWKAIFQQIYGKEFGTLSKDITDLLTTDFQGRIFSVVSYATVGQATKRIYAIVERYEETTFVVKRIYQL